jgi:hypothetical protein
MKNYFAFIDEAGNSSQERFFGLGLLLVGDEVGNLYDSMKTFYDRVWERSKFIKLNRIKAFQESNEIGQIAQIAGSSIKFELKFKLINHTNNLIYKELISNYFRYPDVKFAAIIVDRERIKVEPWLTYIEKASHLLADMIKRTSPCQVCILADDLSKPRNTNKTFEQSLKDGIYAKLECYEGDPIFSVIRLESHASLMLQIVDVLLGAVMYDYKKKFNLISPKLAQRQDVVNENLKSILRATSLTGTQIFYFPNYFAILDANK